jgi:hypothetical protein
MNPVIFDQHLNGVLGVQILALTSTGSLQISHGGESGHGLTVITPTPIPAPRVDVDSSSTVRLDVSSYRDTCLALASDELTADDVVSRKGAHPPKDLDLLAALVFGCDACWCVHCQQRHDLKEMVLHHIAQAAGRIVEGSSPLDAEPLGHRDLHARHVISVPDWLEKSIGKTEVEDALDRLLAEEVVDPVTSLAS